MIQWFWQFRSMESAGARLKCPRTHPTAKPRLRPCLWRRLRAFWMATRLKRSSSYPTGSSMSLPRPLRTALLAISVLGTIALSSCTLTPVHGGAGASTAALQFLYAEPDNRLEQVFFQTLTQRLGETQSPQAPLFDASVTASASR